MTDTDPPQPSIPVTTSLSPEELSSMAHGTLIERMGIEVLEATADRVVATMPAQGNTQPYGLMHGGASVVLAETLGSIAAMLHAGRDRVAVGVDINATHHKAVRPPGVVTGVATPLRLGRAIASYDIVISDADGDRICTSRLTCAIRSAPPGSAGVPRG